MNGHSVEVIGQPFIETNPINFELPQSFDWIFFSSSNGVRYFFESIKTLPSSVKLGCIGSGTAEALQQLGYETHFVGEGLIPEVASTFSALVKDQDKVLFPSAESSLRSVQKELNKDQVIDLAVYRTSTLQQQLSAYPDAIVFTSPSNVRGFVESGNSLEKIPLCIAIGSSTQMAIKEFGIEVEVAPLPNELTLAEFTGSLL